MSGGGSGDFTRGSGSQGEPPSSCHHLQVLLGNGSLSTVMNNPEASAHACFYLMFGYLHYLAKVSAPKGSGGSAGRREGSLQGERRGDSRHRSEMKEGAGGQLLGRNQPTSDFRTFIFHQKHVIWEILRLLCFFFWHAHYLFFFFNI